MPKTTYQAENFRPLADKVFVTDLDSGIRKTEGGIILTDDDMKQAGIRPRWAKVWKVGPLVDDLQTGNWVLVEHGRWTNGIDLETPEGTLRVWMIDYPAHVLCMTAEDPRLERYQLKFG